MTTELREYAERLLSGTGIRAEDAATLAASTGDLHLPDAARPAAEALRDGWAAAQHGGAAS